MPGTEFQANASGNTELASQLQASITALVAAQAQAGNLSSSLQPLASVTNEGSVQLPTLDTNALTQTITQISTAYESIESSFAKLSTKLPEIQKQLDQLSNIKLPENAMSQLKDNVDKINAGMKVLDQGPPYPKTWDFWTNPQILSQLQQTALTPYSAALNN